MTLCDTGPLVALIDASDAHHTRCAEALNRLPFVGLLTTWPCLTEAMYLLGKAAGWRGRDELWSMIADGTVQLHVPEPGEWQRMRALMERYSDTPMDLADASLVTAAESLQTRRVFTVDRHFYIYRQRQGHAFEVVP